ncbi:MAG: ribonuclease H-like domain-containing protein [Planctomycetota bacterium]
MSGEAVRDRLARLLRSPPPEASVESVADKLRARAARTKLAAPALPSGIACEPDSGVLARRETLAPEHTHGDWRLAEALGADPRPLALVAHDPGLASVDLASALYLDTETSGLSGGAGTWVFLVGLGSFRDGRFEVWQGFLAEPAEERELLAEAAARIASASAIVSFFGKSFDRHRLEDKMRLHGIAPPFAGRPHLDLYHPLRRLYGSGFADARLKTLERGLCGVEREDDLPGSRAPAAWFDFLHGRKSELEGVFRHNRDDVLSLVTLAAHLARTLDETRADGSPLAGPSAPRARGIAKCLAIAREHAGALEWFARADERGGGALSAAEERLRRRAQRCISRAS